MKIKLNTTVYFDGTPYPSGSIIDPEAIGANGEAIVHWMWGEPVDDDEPVAIVPVVSDPVAADPVAASAKDADPVAADPVAASAEDAVPAPEPTPEPVPEPPAPRRKRTK
jgi:cell division septation protein DedD